MVSGPRGTPPSLCLGPWAGHFLPSQHAPGEPEGAPQGGQGRGGCLVGSALPGSARLARPKPLTQVGQWQGCLVATARSPNFRTLVHILPAWGQSHTGPYPALLRPGIQAAGRGLWGSAGYTPGPLHHQGPHRCQMPAELWHLPPAEGNFSTTSHGLCLEDGGPEAWEGPGPSAPHGHPPGAAWVGDASCGPWGDHVLVSPGSPRNGAWKTRRRLRGSVVGGSETGIRGSRTRMEAARPRSPRNRRSCKLPSGCLVLHPRQRGRGGQALPWGPTAMRLGGPGPEPQQDCGVFWVRGSPAWGQQSHAQPPPRVQALASSSGPSPAWTDPDPSCTARGPQPPAHTPCCR